MNCRLRRSLLIYGTPLKLVVQPELCIAQCAMHKSSASANLGGLVSEEEAAKVPKVSFERH